MNTPQYCKLPALILVSALAFWVAQPLPAADVSWTATTNNGQWTNAANWSGGVLPGAADDVFLTNGRQVWLGLSGTSVTISNLTAGGLDPSLRLFGNTGVLSVSEAINITSQAWAISTTGSDPNYYAIQTPLLNATNAAINFFGGTWLTAGPDSTWNVSGMSLNFQNETPTANFRINGATVNITGTSYAFGLRLTRGGPLSTAALHMDDGLFTFRRVGIGQQQNGFTNAGEGIVRWSGGTMGNLAGYDALINSYDITDNFGLEINLTNAGDKTFAVESGRILRVGPNARNFDSTGAIAGTNTTGAYLTGTEGRLVIDGGGTVRLYQSNSYTGQVKINNGTLTLVSGSETFDSTAGTYSASIAPSALEIATAGTLDLQNGTGLGGDGTVTFTGGLLRFSSNSVADLSGRIANSTEAIRIDTGSNTVTFASALAADNTGGLTKTGNGTLVLSGANAYSGATTVEAGSLMVNNTSGSGTGTGILTVSSGATLGGSGSIAGDTTVAGTLRPGNSPGVLDFGGDLTLEGAVVMELNGLTRGTQYDGIDVGGQLTYGGTLTLNFGSTFSEGNSFNLFDFASTTGSFDSITFTGAYNGVLANNAGTWTGTIGGQDFSFLDSTGNLNVVPEPSTYALLLVAAAGLWAARKRRLN